MTQKNNNMKLAYKGFNKGLICSQVSGESTKYELNKIYIKQPIPNDPWQVKYEIVTIDILPNLSLTYVPEKRTLRTCTNQGFHYCNTLKDVFKHYSNTIGNEFAIIEVLGNFTNDTSKSITDAFRIVKILSESEIKQIIDKEESDKIDENMNLKLLRRIQTENPELIIAGSTALYLYGIKLDRFKNTNSNFDFIIPYYKLFRKTGKVSWVGTSTEDKMSGNDFDLSIGVYSDIEEELIEVSQVEKTNHSSDAFQAMLALKYLEDKLDSRYIKCDLKIDPKAKYTYINYKGFDYKVGIFEDILEAKLKYSKNGQSKHFKDIREMCGIE